MGNRNSKLPAPAPVVLEDPSNLQVEIQSYPIGCPDFDKDWYYRTFSSDPKTLLVDTLDRIARCGNDYRSILMLVNRLNPGDGDTYHALMGLLLKYQKIWYLNPPAPERAGGFVTPLKSLRELLDRLTFLLWDKTGLSAANLAANRNPYDMTLMVANEYDPDRRLNPMVMIARRLLEDAKHKSATVSKMRSYLYAMYGPNRIHHTNPDWERLVLGDPNGIDRYVLARYADGCPC
jgi:hypothetical protein